MNMRNKNKKEDFDDEVSERYELIEKIGKGVFGIVYKALDKQTDSIVAIKKTFDVYSSKTDSERLLRELILLSHFKQHPNIVKVHNVVNSKSGRDLYLINEYFPANLYNVIRAKILTTNHIKFIVYQLLKILKYIHSAGIIHRNLKPSNILITSESKIKLDDFSLAKSIISKDENYHSSITDYVALRWYRPPEVLLGAEYAKSTTYKDTADETPNKEDSLENNKPNETGLKNEIEANENNTSCYDETNSKSAEYSKKGDLWSVGCIMGEMLCGKTIFPGSSTMNQLNLIVKLVGFPTEDDMNEIKVSLTGLLESIKLLQKIESGTGFDLDLTYDKSDKNNVNETTPRINNQCGFKKLFIGVDENALDLLKKLLTFNPYKRISVNEALDHPFFKECRNQDEELECENKIDLGITQEFRNCVFDYRNRHQIEEKSQSILKTCYNSKTDFKNTTDDIILDSSAEETKKKK